METKDLITAPETISDRRKSLYCSVLFQALSDYSSNSLYDSIVSSNINLSSFESNLPDEINGVKDKNRELSDKISNRLTGLMYFLEELIVAENQSKPKISSSGSHKLNNNANEVQNSHSDGDELVPDHKAMVTCEEITSLVKLHRLKEEEFVKSQTEIRAMDEELGCMVDELQSILAVKKHGLVEDKGIHASCKCQII